MKIKVKVTFDINRPMKGCDLVDGRKITKQKFLAETKKDFEDIEYMMRLLPFVKYKVKTKGKYD